jgi:rod shape-determining protein MreD
MQGGWVILMTLVFAMVLSVVHLPMWMPDWLGWLRPEWIVLVLFFWVIEHPDRIGMVLAWVLGLFLDVLLSEPLGINGLCLAVITFVAWSFYERLQMYSVIQQAGVVFLLALALELTKVVLLQDTVLTVKLILPAATTSMVWPLVAVMLRRLSHQFPVK